MKKFPGKPIPVRVPPSTRASLLHLFKLQLIDDLRSCLPHDNFPGYQPPMPWLDDIANEIKTSVSNLSFRPTL
jgi:hypothetical protein